MSAVGSAQRRPRVRNTKRIPGDILALFYGVNINDKDSDEDSTKAALPVVEEVAPPSPRPSTSRKTPSPMTTPLSRRSSRPGSSSRAQSQADSDITFNISHSMLGALNETCATHKTTASKLPTTGSYPASQDADVDMEASKQSSIDFDYSQSMLDALKDETIATNNTTKSRASTESVKSRISEANAGLKSARESQGSVSFNFSPSMVGAFNDTVATRVTSTTAKSRLSERILEDSVKEVEEADENDGTVAPDDISFDVSKSMLACFDNTVASRMTAKSRRSSAATTKSATDAHDDEEDASDELFSGEEGDSATPKASPNTSRSIGTETIPISMPLPSKLRLSTIPPSVPATATASKSRLSTLPIRSAPVTSLNSSGPRSAKRNRSNMAPNSPKPGSATSTPVSKRPPTHFTTPKSKNLNATISAETQTSFGEASEETQTSDVIATSPFLGKPMEIDPRTPTPPRIPRPRKSVGFRKDVQVSDNSREFIPLKDSTHRSDLNASSNIAPLPVQITGMSLPSTITQSASTLSAASSSTGPLSAASVSSTGTASSAFSFKVPQLPNQRTKLRMSTYMAPTHASEARRSTTSSNATNSPLCSKSVQPRRTISHVTTISSQNTAGYRKPLIDFADPKFAEMRKQDWQRTPPAKIPQSRLERMELQGGEKLHFGDESDVQTSVTSKSHGAGDTFDVSKSNKTSDTYTVSEKGENSATISTKSGEKTFTVLETSESGSTRPSARLSSEEGTDKTKSVTVLDDSDEEPTTPATRKPEDMETPKSTRKPMPLTRRTIALTALDAYGTPSFGHPCSLAARLAGTTLNDKDDLLVESSRRAKKLSSGESPALEIRPIDSDSEEKKKEDDDEVVDDSLEEESPKKTNQRPPSDDEEDEESPKKTTTEPHGYYNVRPPSDNEDEISDEEEEEEASKKTTTEPRGHINVRPMSDDDFLDEEEEEEAPSTPCRRVTDLDSSIYSLGTPGREPAGNDNVYIEPMDFDDESANSETENNDPRPSSSTPRRRRASFIDPDDMNKTNVFDETMNDTIITPNKLKVMRQKPKYILAQPELNKAHTPDIEEANLRRSRRTRVPRLNNFLGQRINYERGPDGLPVIAGITEVEVKDARAIKFMTADDFKITEKEHEAKRRTKKRKEFAKRQRELEAEGLDL